MMDEYEDAILAAEAEKRLSQKVKYSNHEDIMKRIELSEADLDDIQVALTNSANDRTRKNVGLKGTKSRLEASSYYSSTKADDTASGGGSKR